MTVACLQCNSENDARRRFCNFCGSSIELICPCCSFGNRIGDLYCGGCGVKLDGVTPAAAAPTAPALEEPTLDQAKRDELRTITVMMADLEGFAEMTDVHGREKQTAVMNAVFERLAKQHIVDEFDGYIDKFLDGDIMALFGAPIAHEDAPERAARAAVRMHQELARLHEEGVIPPDTPLKLRIGLNTGPVRVGGVGAGGRMEYTAMGDTVNLAARLMTACAWGGSLISVNTHRRVAPSFELEELEPVKVKGKSQPVPIWSVLAEKRRAARVEIAQAEGMSPMVGRQAQLETVASAYAKAAAGTGQAVGVRGEAGIGKSRLVFELQQRVRDEARFIEGRCLSYGLNIGFLPIRDVLSELCGIDDTDSAEVRRERIRATLTQLGLDPAELGPPIGFILSLDFGDRQFNQLDPQDLRARLREAAFTALEAASRAQPIVVFIDDLQWCDADSRELLDDLVARCPQTRLLVLLAFRPDFQHDYDQLEQFTLVEPERLGVEDTRRVVGSLLAQRGYLQDEERVEPSLAEAVYHKSQGNPFFIDQTVNALIERSEQSGRPTIDFRRGRLLITEDELSALVPDSVEEILLARIDKLPEAPRGLLQAAAVAMIGRYFRRSALEFCLEEGHLDELLAVLRERDLVRLENRSEQDEEYVFEHALTRDVAYNNLLRAERRRLHGRVGEYIEDHYSASLSAYIDDLSYHYYNSAHAAKAVHYLPLSAARAARSFSNTQAVVHYKRALEKADELGRDGSLGNLTELRLEVLKGLTSVQSLIGDREGLEYGRQRLELARELNDRDAVIDANYMLAHQYTALGMFEEAQASWNQVRAEYEATASWDGVRDSEYGIGNLCYLQGRYEEALEHFQKALEIQVEKMEFEPFGQWIAHNNIAAASEAMGRFQDVLEACHVCYELLGKMADDDPMRMRLECYTSGNLGSAHRNLGNLTEAEAAYRRTLEIAQATGEKSVEAEVRHWLGRTLSLLGRLTDAREHLDEALVLARETGSSRWEAGTLVALAEVALLVGDLGGSAELLGQARQLLQQVGELAGQNEVGIAEGRLLLAREQAGEAIARLQEVLASAESAHGETDRAVALAELAFGEVSVDRRAEGREHAATAVELSRRLGLKQALTRGLRALAEADSEEAGQAALEAADDALAMAEAIASPEEIVAGYGLRARLRAGTDPDGARADMEAAEAALAAIEPLAGEAYTTAARQRHLAPLRDKLTTP